MKLPAVLPKLLFSLFVLLSIVVLYLPTKGFFRNQYDDSYITYRYAVNLAEGKGLVFNVHERADSASSFSYTVLLAGAYKLGITNLEVMAGIIGILSAVGISYFVASSLQRVTKYSWIGYLFGYLVGIHGFISGWAVSGMETVFFTFLVTWFISNYFFQKEHNHFLHVCLLALILLTRMEGVILGGVWFITEVVYLVSKRDKKAWRIFFIQCLFLGGVFGSLYVFKYLYYGSIVSTAVAFKRIAIYYLPNPVNVIVVWGGTSLVVSLVAVYFVCKKYGRKYWGIVLYLILSFISVLMGPHSDGARYSVHLLPGVMIFAGMGVATLISDKRKVISYLLLSGIILQTLLSTFVVRFSMVHLMGDQECRSLLGQYINTTLPRGAYVVSGDLGLIAYQAKDISFLDLSGLTSNDILHAYQRKQTIDPIFLSHHPLVLADTFLQKDGVLHHQLLTNQVEHIEGQHVYSHLFTENTFKKILYSCHNRQRTFAIVDISSIYK